MLAQYVVPRQNVLTIRKGWKKVYTAMKMGGKKTLKSDHTESVSSTPIWETVRIVLKTLF